MKKNKFTKPKFPPRGVPQVKPQVGEQCVTPEPQEDLALFYMSKQPITAREIGLILSKEFGQKTELWEELQIIEWITEFGHSIDIEQTSKDAFAEEDLAFLEEHQAATIYSISALDTDLPLIRKCFAKIAAKAGGFLCSDTDDFLPLLPL